MASDGIPAVQGHRKYASNGCLTDTTMSAEDVAMRDASLRERIHQRHSYMLLAGDIGEALGTILTSENLVCHRGRDDSPLSC